MEIKKWNNEARLFMIDKSEFYSDPKVYQFGFYDGYHRALKDSKHDEMLEMLINLTNKLRCTTEYEAGVESFNKIIKESEQLIKQATEL